MKRRELVSKVMAPNSINVNATNKVSFVTNWQDSRANTAVYDSLQIEKIMPSQLDIVQHYDEIRDADVLLARANYHAIPVLVGNNLQGIVTSTDLINYLLKKY